jgi:hypothetical protein
MHLSVIQSCQIEAIVVPWDGISQSGNSSFTDETIRLLFQFAPSHHLKIIPLIPDSQRRTTETVTADLNYYSQKYFKSPAQFTIGGKPVVLFESSHTIDFTSLISVTFPGITAVAITDSFRNLAKAYEDGYGGFLTYHDSGVSWTANRENWPMIAKWGKDRGILVGFGISPGFNNSLVSRWARHLQRPRNCSSYYDAGWQAAVELDTRVVLINSFNDWVDGTGIETVDGRGLDQNTWCDVDTSGDYYVNKTRHWVASFKGL